VFLLKKEGVSYAGKATKERMVQTLKMLCENPNGLNRNLPHLQGLHIMTISNHFNTLCNGGLVEKVSFGTYKLAPKGWQFMELANSLQRAYNEVYDLL
jgi:predicted transcriptional regulator